MVHKFDESNFEAEVLQSDLPVFVDFYADWCGPCKMMSPVIDKLAECGDLAQKYGIMSIPNMVFFKGGEPVDRVVGAIPKPQMKERFEKNAN